MINSLPTDKTATDFAKYIAENKPYLIEIEDEIQKMGKYGEMELKISIRGGRVEKVSFWKGRTWLLDRDKLTQSTT
jgi:hypothetical protein